MTLATIETRSPRMGKTRQQPMDPAEAARLAYERRKNPDQWGVNRPAMALPANAEVDVEDADRTRVARARRYDVFERMRHHRTPKLEEGAYNAVRRLQEQLAILHRTQGTSDAIRTAAKGSAGVVAMITADFGAARVAAGHLIRDVLDGMKPWRAKLILELCETGIVRGSEPNWHEVVRRHTGTMERDKRGQIVRDCCDDLAESWRRIDNEPVRAVG